MPAVIGAVDRAIQTYDDYPKKGCGKCTTSCLLVLGANHESAFTQRSHFMGRIIMQATLTSGKYRAMKNHKRAKTWKISIRQKAGC